MLAPPRGDVNVMLTAHRGNVNVMAVWRGGPNTFITAHAFQNKSVSPECIPDLELLLGISAGIGGGRMDRGGNLGSTDGKSETTSKAQVARRTT